MNRILPILGVIALVAATGCCGQRACGPCGGGSTFGSNYAPTQNYYSQQPTYMNPGCPSGNCGGGGMYPSGALTPIPQNASIATPVTAYGTVPTTTANYSPTLFQPKTYTSTAALDYAHSH